MNTPTIYTATPADLSPPVQTDSFCVDLVLVTDYQKLKDEFKQLAAENVALKNVFSQKEIPSEAVDAFMETAVMDHDWNETSEWSWVENETEVIHAVLEALKPETPATDRIVAGIKADGVEEFAAYQRSLSSGWASDKGPFSCLKIAEDAEGFAQQLREGADK
ncbi:hypothetical protein ACXDJA_002590 [Klebsiella variicola]